MKRAVSVKIVRKVQMKVIMNFKSKRFSIMPTTIKMEVLMMIIF